jgi:mannose-6-phosphate isomerase-like protein (cupin superfamily)
MGKSLFRPPGEGAAYWVLGGLYEVLASSEETGGASTILKFTIPEGAGPPPHTHPGSESVYVLDGRARFNVDGETIEGGPGAFFHFPAGTLENFEPSGQVQLVVTYEPGGIDKFFAEVGEPATRREVPPPPETPPDLERLAEVGERYGMQIQASAELTGPAPVMRCSAKSRTSSLRSSNAVSRPPSTRRGLTTRSAATPSLPT